MFDDLLKTIRPIVWREEKTFRERCNYENLNKQEYNSYVYVLQNTAYIHHFDNLEQDCGNSIADALQCLLQCVSNGVTAVLH